MRKSLCIIALTGAISAVHPALAEDATSALLINGKIIPGSCTPTLTNGGKVDYGTIETSSLFKASNSLGVRNITLSISCSDTGYVGFTATDNRSDSVPENIEVAQSFGSSTVVKNSSSDRYLFGLGKTLTDKVIGAFTIGIDLNNVVLDGKALIYQSLIYSINEGKTWNMASPANGVPYYSPGKPFILTFANDNGSVSKAFKEAEIPLIISAAVVDARELMVTDKVILDGNMTFGIVYL